MFRVGVVDAGFGMNILLDECVPWPLRRRLAGHTCATPQQRGWKHVLLCETSGAPLRFHCEHQPQRACHNQRDR